MRRILWRCRLLGLCAAWGLLSIASGQAQATLFFNDFEHGVSRNPSGIWTGYDNGFFGDPQWLETDGSHNHTPGGSKSARAYEADPWVYNSYADFGATGSGLAATVYLYDDLTYDPPYTEDYELEREPYIEVRNMFTLWGDSLDGPDETDPTSDYLQIRLIPDAHRPEDPAPEYYSYGIRTKYNDDNAVGIIDTDVRRKAGWLKLTIEVDSVADGGEVRFFIDDVPVGTSQRSGADFRWVMMGATGPTYQNYWYDDISVVDLNGDYGDFWHGDYNGDGVTDAADYAWWRKENSNHPYGFTTWQDHFGWTASGAGSGAGDSLAAPEPATVWTLALTGWVLLTRVRRLRRLDGSA